MRRGHEVIVTIDVSLYISAPSNVAENALFICTRIYGHCRFVTLSREEERAVEGTMGDTNVYKYVDVYVLRKQTP